MNSSGGDSGAIWRWRPAGEPLPRDGDNTRAARNDSMFNTGDNLLEQLCAHFKTLYLALTYYSFQM